MKEYEIVIEYINPCGGDEHSRKEFTEAYAESPEEYVKANSRWPILETAVLANGDTVITTGDGKGYLTKYFFAE